MLNTSRVLVNTLICAFKLCMMYVLKHMHYWTNVIYLGEILVLPFEILKHVYYSVNGIRLRNSFSVALWNQSVTV